MSRRSSPRTSPKGKTGKTRTQLFEASERFTTACINNSSIATLSHLVAYFSASNIFYCRSGDGINAAKSCLQTIHADSDIQSTETTSSCTRKQLTKYFLRTLTNDPKRVDRMAPLIDSLLKDAQRQRLINDTINDNISDTKTTDDEESKDNINDADERNINVATVTKAVEQERTRRIEEDLQHTTSTNEERKINQVRASQMMDKERSRRMSETQTMNETISKSEELLKQSNVQMVTKLATAEQERRSSVVGGGNQLLDASLMQEIASMKKEEEEIAALEAELEAEEAAIEVQKVKVVKSPKDKRKDKIRRLSLKKKANTKANATKVVSAIPATTAAIPATTAKPAMPTATATPPLPPPSIASNVQKGEAKKSDTHPTPKGKKKKNKRKKKKK